MHSPVLSRWSAVLALLLACGDDAADVSSKNDGPHAGSDGGLGAPSFGNGSEPGAAADGGLGLPPEREIELPFEVPRAGRTSVYVPNPSTHRVAVVNASTFSVESIGAGLAPTYTTTVPGEDIAIVINVASRDVSVLRTTDGRTSANRYTLRHDPNAIAVAPDGKHAVVYLDARAGSSTARSFQDVSVVNLSPEEQGARAVSVGFRPYGVQFSADGTRAFVITEDGISIIDLSAVNQGPTIARLVSLGTPLDAQTSNDVHVLSDGRHAIARRSDGQLRLVNLETGLIRPLDLSALQQPAPQPTDAGINDAGLADAGAANDGGTAPLPAGPLDISDVDVGPDGSYALAVVRNAGALLRIPLPQGFEEPGLVEVTKIQGALVGSVVVAKSAPVAALYTTALPVEAVVLVDLTGATPPRTVRLRKAVRSVALTDNGGHAFVLHQPATAHGDDPEAERIASSEGYTLVNVASGFPKLQLTQAAIRERDILVTADQQRIFALVHGAGFQELQVADLNSFEVITTPLAKPPSSIGLVPQAQRVFIGQTSEGGMITFVDAVTGMVAHAVSGFELSGRVRQ